MFNEREVVGFTNELRGTENDLFFHATFENQNKAEDSQKVVKIDVKKEATEIKIRLEVLVDDKNSSSSETDNQIEPLRSITINPEYEVVPDN